MKRNKFWGVSLMATLMVLGLTACSNDEFADYKNEKDGIKSFTSFTATIGEEAITRAYLGDAGVEGKKRMYWNKGDEIAVFSDADSDFKTFKVTSVSSDNKATIQGEKISGTAFYGYYPNRDGNLSLDNDNPKLLHASLSVNDFDEGENTQTPMVAISNSRNLAFKQVTGMIHVSIGGIYRLEKVTLSGNDNEVLYGNGTIDLSVDEPMFKLDNNQNGNTSLGGTIRQGDEQMLGDGVAEIYFSLPPMTLTKGFTLEIKGYDESGKSIVFEKTTESGVVIKRAQINHYTLENVMEELNAQGNDGIIEFADENVKAICVENWDTDGDGELSYKEAAAVTDIGETFRNSSIKSFDEFQYFTGVTSIGYEAFYASSLVSIIIPENLTIIGGHAFNNCRNLSNIRIPESVVTIGQWAFSACESLTDFKIPSSVIKIDHHTFYNTKLKSIIIGEGVISITSDAFSYYNYKTSSYSSPIKVIWLTNTPPNGYDYVNGTVNYVANDNFTLLSNTMVYPFLSSMFEVDGVKYVPVSPSERTCDVIDCDYDKIAQYVNIGETVSYQGVKLKVNQVNSYTFYDCTNVQSVTLSMNITSIGEKTFSGCSSLTDIQIGQNVEIIGNGAFSGCSSIETIYIPSSVTSIGNNVFSGCSSLKNVIMEDNEDDAVLSLGYNNVNNTSKPLFTDCPLDEIYIGRNVSYSTSQYSGYSPFYRNTSLRSVTITDRETEISDNEFYGCTNLKNVSIGDGVSLIGNRAFSGCSSLDYFAFGSAVETIGQEAFSDCVNVTRIISHAATPPTCGTQALDDINKWNCTLQVPSNCITQYQQAEQWKEFFFIE